MKNIFLKQKIFLLFGSSLQCNIIGTIKKLSDFIVQETNSGLIKQKTDDDRKKLEEISTKKLQKIVPIIKAILNTDKLNVSEEKKREIIKNLHQLQCMARYQSRMPKDELDRINAVVLHISGMPQDYISPVMLGISLRLKIDEKKRQELSQNIKNKLNYPLHLISNNPHSSPVIKPLAVTIAINSSLLTGLSGILQDYQIAEVFYMIKDSKQELQISYKNNTENMPPLILRFHANGSYKSDIIDENYNYHFLEIDLENSIISGVTERYKFENAENFEKELQGKINSLITSIPAVPEGMKNHINNIPKNFIELLHDLITNSSNIKSTISIPDCGLGASPIENDWLKISLIGIIIIAVLVVIYRYFTTRSVQDQINGDPQHNTDENIISNTDEGNNINNTDEGNNLIGAEAQ